jgi:hypothetical protein
MSRITMLHNGGAAEVAAELSDKPATTEELRLALINALGLIHDLQQRLTQATLKLERVERTANKAANDASCLANGIAPD